MPYIISVERLGIEKGLEQGRQEGRQEGRYEAVMEVLKMRFGTIPEELKDAIASLQDETLLMDILRRSITIDSIAAFQEVVNSYVSDRSSEGF